MSQSESLTPVAPQTVTHDGWTHVSTSVDSADSLIGRLTPAPPDPAPEPAPEPVEAAEATPAPVEPTVDRPRDEKGKFAKGKTPASERVAQIRAQIDEVTRERYTVTRALEAERAELERLRQDKARLAPSPTPPPAPAAPAPSDLGTKPTWKAFEAEGKTWDEYEDAKDTWIAQKARAEALAEIEAREAKAAQTRAQESQTQAETEAERAHRTRVEAAKAKYADFDTVAAQLDDVPLTPFLRDAIRLHPGGAELFYALAKNPEEALALAELPLTNAMMTALMESSNPVPLASYLAQHPDETQQIARKPPASALVALGKIVSRLEGASHGSPAPAPVVVSSAKPPLGRVGGSHSTGVSRSDTPPKEFDAYVQWANKRESDRRLARR